MTPHALQEIVSKASGCKSGNTSVMWLWINGSSMFIVVILSGHQANRPAREAQYRRPSYAPACATATAAVLFNQGLTRRSSGRRPGTVVPAHLYVRRRKREESSQVQGIARASLKPERIPPIRTTGSLLISEFLAGRSELHRTTAPVGNAIFGAANSERVSLVVAARPSAGRSPAARHHAQCGAQSQSCFVSVRAHA